MQIPRGCTLRLPLTTACQLLAYACQSLAAGALPGNPTTAKPQIIVVKRVIVGHLFAVKSVIIGHLFVVFYVNMVYKSRSDPCNPPVKTLY